MRFDGSTFPEVLLSQNTHVLDCSLRNTKDFKIFNDKIIFQKDNDCTDINIF